jgi:hypothetical protein
MGRFINADALITTGQGLLGNNMLSYCQNNPVTCYDLSGQAAIWRATVSSHTNIDLFLGDGGRYAYASSSAQAGSSILAKLKNMVNNQSTTTAQQNMKTHGATFYQGTLVVSATLPVDKTAFSFGVIIMDDYYQNVLPEVFNTTLDHEYGHALHLNAAGIASYTVTAAIPSLIGAGIAESNIPILSSWISSNYYNLPWERIADYYGGVDRNHSPIANAIGAIYWVYTLSIG